MKELAVYDPTIAERGMDAMTDQMITRININHDMLKIAHRIHLREANLKRRISVTEDRLRRERKKARIRARRNGIACSAALGIAAWFAHVALESGLLKINFAIPLAFTAVALVSWTVCKWRHDSKRKKD